MPKIIREVKPLVPYWTTSDKELVKLYHGDVVEVLQRLPSRSVQMVVTSPPYWGLRCYNAGEKEIGSERTPEEFVGKMVEVFGELKRVLRNDGTIWLNLGDSYGEGEGQLSGIPWRVALELQTDGWILRQDIIWSKPSPMPESVTNRCTKAHEYLFLLALRNDYYYDQEAIREQSLGNYNTKGFRGENTSGDWVNNNSYDNNAKGKEGKGGLDTQGDNNRRNKRSVWNISSQGYEGAHFATFPPKLIEPCILAGTSEYGCCVECGKPWSRVVDKTKLTRERPNDYVKRKGEEGTGNSCSNSVAGVKAITTGWKQQCGCNTTEVKPCTVLDPFIGSGTSCVVSIDLGRRSVGIDLSETYLKNNAIPRIEGALLARPALAHLTGRVTKVVKAGKVLGVKK